MTRKSAIGIAKNNGLCATQLSANALDMISQPITPFTAPSLIREGFNLLWHPQLRWLVMLPIAINILLFGAATWSAAAYLSSWLDWLINSVPDWLQWLVWIIWLLFGLLTLVIYGFTFTLLANVIGSPFYGIIAERVIAIERGDPQQIASTNAALYATAWRSFRRELQIIRYMLPRTIGVILLTLLVSFVPLINIVAPLIAASWAAWLLAIQYLDYPADSNRLMFDQVIQRAREQRVLSLSFGLSALVAAAIPVANLLLLPASVIGGTLLWQRAFGDANQHVMQH